MENAIFARTSVREFTDQKVDASKIKPLLKAAMQAPSAGNQQPWEFYVVSDRDVLAKLGQAGKYSEPAGKAPVVIVVCNRNRGMHYPEFVPQDMAACVQNMLLEAVNQSLGAVWLGVAPREGRMEIVRNIMNLPANLDPFALVAVGYAAEEQQAEKRYDESRVRGLKDFDFAKLA
ncbi:MAG: nitroreductase family protein [Coriobacteriia bacterium]|nr:nitroreductase family protein [Coriobacteriia bacterium]